MAFITKTDLENALGVHNVSAIFDDDSDGVPDAAPIAACLEYACAECNSFLEKEYSLTLTTSNVPTLIKYAAIDFACAYAVRRRPDLTKAMGEEPWQRFLDAACAKMKRISAAEQLLPPSVARPANVGASVRTGLAGDTTTPSRVWQDPGDF